MDKETARKSFDFITGILVEMAMEGGTGSVHDLAAVVMNEVGTDDLLQCLEIIISAEFTMDELNLPEDNTLEVKTTPEGIRYFCAYLYGFGALRFLRLSPGQPMGAGMHGDRGPTVQGPLR